MDKDELIGKLKKKGFDCGIDGNIPMIRTDDKSFSLDKMRVIMSDLGYNGSFGFRIGGKSLSPESDQSHDDESDPGFLRESDDGQISFI